MSWMTREEAVLAVAEDVLANPGWAARVVVAAIVAETQLAAGNPGRATLSAALANARVA